MVLTEIDKIRKKIVKEGFKPWANGSTLYEKYIVPTHKFKQFIISDENIRITIKFQHTTMFENINNLSQKNWYVTVIVNIENNEYSFKKYDYYDNITNDLLLKINQYIAFEKFVKI